MIDSVRSPLLNPANPFVRALADYDIRHSEGSSYKSRCPAHNDSTPSLSVSAGDNGGIVVHCHAGCSTESVVQAVGCKLADLMPPKPRKPKASIAAEYPYLDADGELLYQAVRMNPKAFRQRRPINGGGWEWNMKGVQRVLYRLPQLLAAKAEADICGEVLTVFVVEGEKDADRLASLGIIATTNVGGAGKWLKAYSECLAGCNVVILADNDKSGRDHASQVAASTKAAGALSVKVVDLPGLPPKGDVSDWLNAREVTA